MSASHLEGEIDGIVKTKANAPVKLLKTPSTLKSSPPTDFPAPATLPRIPAPPPAPEITPVKPPAEKHAQKPSQHVINLIEGHGTTSTHPSDPVLSHGIQTPSVITKELTPVLEREEQAEWLMWTNFVEELLMAQETSEAEALEP